MFSVSCKLTFTSSLLNPPGRGLDSLWNTGVWNPCIHATSTFVRTEEWKKGKNLCHKFLTLKKNCNVSKHYLYTYLWFIWQIDVYPPIILLHILSVLLPCFHTYFITSTLHQSARCSLLYLHDNSSSQSSIPVIMTQTVPLQSSRCVTLLALFSAPAKKDTRYCFQIILTSKPRPLQPRNHQ